MRAVRCIANAKVSDHGRRTGKDRHEDEPAWTTARKRVGHEIRTDMAPMDTCRYFWERILHPDLDDSTQVASVPCRYAASGRKNSPISWQRNQDSPKKTLHWR